jgi:TM2 domain-containing membrane protein YozV
MAEETTIKSSKKRLIALLLAIFTIVGHRIYVGKVGTSMLYFITVGFFGIGWLMDIFMILIGSFTDKSGHFLRDWT